MTSPDPHTDPGVSIARVPACVLCVGKQDEIDRLRARIDAVRKVWRTYRQAPSHDLADALNSLIDPEVDHDQP